MPAPRAHPAAIATAERALARVEPRFRPVIQAHRPCTVGRRRPYTHFESLARAIVFQQLAGRAALAIWGRTRSLVTGAFSPEAVLGLAEADLRGAGLSANKAASVRDLAQHVADGTVPIRSLSRVEDEQVVEHLTVVRGIGRWTAEMFLMFQLGRIDIWPAGDFGVRKGLAIVMGLDPMPNERQMPALGESFAPHRSVAAWYCWRATEPGPRRR